MSLIWVGLICIFLQSHADAQSIEFKSLTVQDGLSCSFVNTIVQDSEGFIWIGTFDGLNRYDGYEFTVYRNRKGNLSSVAADAVQDLFLDRQNRLWIGTQSGLDLYDRYKDRFFHFRSSGGNDLDVMDITQLADGTVIFCSSNGLFKVVIEDSTVVPFLADCLDAQASRPDNFRLILADRQNRFWIGTPNQGLVVVDLKSGQVVQYRVNPNADIGLITNAITALFEDDNGTIWIGTESGLHRFDERTGRFKNYHHDPNDPSTLTNDICWNIFQDSKSKLWISTQEGLNLFDMDSGRCLRFKHDENIENSLNSNNVHSLYKDKQGILWIGGPEGLNYSRFERKNFYTFRSSGRNENSLSHNSVTCFSVDGWGNLWIGTDGGGLNYLDRKNRRFYCYRYNPLNINSLRTNSVLALLTAEDESVWTGCFLGGLSLLNSKSGRFTHFMYDPLNPSSLNHNDVRDIYRDRRGRIWVATNGRGLNLLTGSKQKIFHHYVYDSANPSSSLVNDFCLTIKEDHEGILWIGTYSGLSRFDSDKKLFTNYTTSENNPTGLSNNWIYSIIEDSKQRIWIGTSSGLNLFDRQSNTFTVFGLKDGFPSEVINGILEDSSGRLWISTNAGLVRFDVETRTVNTYTIQDGLQGDEFIHGSCLKLPTGEMAFGGTNGFTLFHPDSIRDIQSMPPMVITGFYSYNMKTKLSEITLPIRNLISENETIRLTHDQAKMFTLVFTTLEFLQPGKIQYKYKLDGYHEEWINTGKNRSATFTNLGAGRYTFRVTSTNSDGAWNSQEKRIQIHILPPLWKSPGAYILYFLLLLISVVVYHKASMNWIHLKADLKIQKMEKEKALELESLKSRFFTNISHEFRTPLTLILVPLQEIISSGHQKDWPALKNRFHLMQRSAERLLRLVNQVLDFNKIESGRLKLELKEIDIVAFGREIANAFTSLATDKHITFTFGSNRPRLYGWFDPDKVDMIIFNLLSNAFKFTPRYGEISLKIKHLRDTQVEIRVEDTGPGIPDEHLKFIFERFYLVDHPVSKVREGAGIGLSLSKELAEMHGGSIAVHNIEGKGACFTVVLPRGDKPIHADRSVSDLSTFQTDAVQTGEDGTEDDVPVPDHETLLFIEDDGDLRSYLKNELKDQYRILEASDGSQGMKKARQFVPDLIVCDVMMCGMDGFEICKNLKNNAITSHIPIILLTARSGEEQEMEGLESGADDYITKPFRLQALRARIKNLLESRRKWRERFSREIRVEPSDIVVTPTDEKFLRRAIQIIEANLSDPDFSVESFGREIGLSRSQLFRKIKALTSETPNDFIQTIRLRRAAQLLGKTDLSITEITYEVGFKYPSHFSQMFHEKFGQSPKEFRRHSTPCEG